MNKLYKEINIGLLKNHQEEYNLDKILIKFRQIFKSILFIRN